MNPWLRHDVIFEVSHPPGYTLRTSPVKINQQKVYSSKLVINYSYMHLTKQETQLCLVGLRALHFSPWSWRSACTFWQFVWGEKFWQESSSHSVGSWGPLCCQYFPLFHLNPTNLNIFHLLIKSDHLLHYNYAVHTVDVISSHNIYLQEIVLLNRYSTCT